MSYSHQYNLTFSKSFSTARGLTYRAVAKEGGSADLAIYLTQSNLTETLNQIGEQPEAGNVKVGETILPNHDFKALLQEWSEHIQPFSIENEIRKLRKYTLLPITHVVFDDRYQHGESYVDENMDYIKIRAKLYIAEHDIGEIQYMSGHFGPMYDTQTIQQLVNWDKIIELFHRDILAEVVKQEPLAASVEVQNYETLSVKNTEGRVIKNASFRYIDGRWVLNVYGLNGTIRRMEVKVQLTPPKLNF